MGTMRKICRIIADTLLSLGRPLQGGDVMVDWGCGSGRWLIFAPLLFEVQGLITVGIECDPLVANFCQWHLCRARHFGVPVRSHVVFADSASMNSFCPARVVLNYDGKYGPYDERGLREHRTIMHKVFGSNTVDAVFSTKLTPAFFAKYFCVDVGRWSWLDCSLLFGHSRYKGYIYVRQSRAQRLAHQQRFEPRLVLAIERAAGHTCVFVHVHSEKDLQFFFLKYFFVLYVKEFFLTCLFAR